jgi:hypothetical protein
MMFRSTRHNYLENDVQIIIAVLVTTTLIQCYLITWQAQSGLKSFHLCSAGNEAYGIAHGQQALYPWAAPQMDWILII